MTEQEIRIASTELDLKIAEDNKVIADARVIVAPAEARIAGYMVEKTKLYLDFAKSATPSE